MPPLHLALTRLLPEAQAHPGAKISLRLSPALKIDCLRLLAAIASRLACGHWNGLAHDPAGSPWRVLSPIQAGAACPACGGALGASGALDATAAGLRAGRDRSGPAPETRPPGGGSPGTPNLPQVPPGPSHPPGHPSRGLYERPAQNLREVEGQPPAGRRGRR